MAARSLRSYGRHSRKSSYSFVTIRKLLTRCGARMPLMGAEYRRVASRGALLARAQSELAACDPEGFEATGSPQPREASQTTAGGTTVQKIGATSIAEVGKMIGELQAAGPARMIAESLTPKPGIREHNRGKADIHDWVGGEPARHQ